MSNKPRCLPESPSSNLFRIALLLVLAPGCASTIQPKSVISDNPKIEKQNVSTGLDVRYSHHLRIEDDVVVESEESINEDIPLETQQPLEIGFIETTGIKTLEADHELAEIFEMNTAIATRPIEVDMANCSSEPITGFVKGGSSRMVKIMRN